MTQPAHEKQPGVGLQFPPKSAKSMVIEIVRICNNFSLFGALAKGSP
jgi:hypothetical protein